jgi:hypothetical protein
LAFIHNPNGSFLSDALEEIPGWPPSLFKHPQISLVFVQPGEMVAATCVFEGTGEEVETQRNSLFGLAREFDGIRAPDENGQFGYRLTFAIAYLRV